MDELTVIENKIYEIRGQRVMLDFDLAEMYEVETKYLKRIVRRNITRFPEDFMFELSKEESNSLLHNIRCQNGTLENTWKKTFLPTVRTMISNLKNCSMLSQSSVPSFNQNQLD